MILGGRAKSDKGRDTGTHHGFYKFILVVRKKFFRHRLIRVQTPGCAKEMPGEDEPRASVRAVSRTVGLVFV